MTTKIELLSSLLRELEISMGISDLSVCTLDAMKSSFDQLKCPQSELYKEFCHLAKAYSSVKPRYGVLTNYLSRIKTDLSQAHNNGKPLKKALNKSIKNIKTNIKHNKKNMLASFDTLKTKANVVMIHDYSHTVQDILRHWHTKNRKLHVVIAEQDYYKTHENIEFLHHAKIPFQVVPAYMLSHLDDKIDLFLCGAVTLKQSMNLVVDPGSYGIISQLRSMNIPSYACLMVDKFSFWKSSARKDVEFKVHTRKHIYRPINYKRIKYSHDRVPSTLFEKTITDKGLFDAEELKEYFDTQFENFTTK